MASQPSPQPDIIDPQSPDETPASPGPIEQPIPAEPVSDPGGDTIEPGHSPTEIP